MDDFNELGKNIRGGTGRDFKSNIFADLFNDEKNAIELFSFFENEDLPDNTKVVLCDDELSKVLALRNDLAFIINDTFIVVSEHQANWNQNMPLRILRYFVDILYTIALDRDSIYSNKLIELPTPKFYVAYNGKEVPRSHIMRLSDAYFDKSKGFDLEATAKIVDIEFGRLASRKHPHVLGYSFLISEIHRHLDNGVHRDMAMKLAVEKCLEEGHLQEYIEHRGLEEVLAMLNYEYNHADEIKFNRKEAREEGLTEGKAEGLAEGKAEIIRNMREAGFSEEDIARATKMTLLHETPVQYEVTSK